MPMLLGIDVGTTNWKAAVYDEQGRLQALSATPTRTHYDSQGRAFYDPTEMWAQVAQVVRDCLAKLPEPETISAVAVTSMGESGVPLDAHNRLLYPAIAWFDTCSLPQANQMKEQIGTERIFRITGLDVNPVFSASKILWLREHEPELLKKAVKWLSISDYINYQLSHEFATDYTIASRTMLLDLRQRAWSDELLEALDIPASLLPPLYASGTVIGYITPEAARETGLVQGTPVVMGGHDHFCGFLASGCLLGNRVLDSSGTVESIIALLAPGSTPPETFQGLRIGSFLDPARYSSLAGVQASGLSVDWAIKQLASLQGWNLSDYESVARSSSFAPAKLELRGTSSTQDSTLPYRHIFEQVRKTNPGADGVLYLPHLRGAGGPFWDPLSRGAFIGLRASHSQPDLIRAVLEGISFEVRIILETMEQAFGYHFDVVNTIGGSARNLLWQELKASILGRPVELPDVEEATSKGAALLAGVGVGVYQDLYDASRRTHQIKTRLEPDPELVERYNEIFALYQQIYPALKTIHAGLDNSL